VLLAQVKSGTAVSVTDTIPGMEVPVLLEGMSTNEKFCFKVKKIVNSIMQKYIE